MQEKGKFVLGFPFAVNRTVRRLFRVRHHSFACCVLLVSILLASAAAEAETTVANYCFFFL